MNLFALTTIAASRIVRFPLTAELQDEVEATFDAQLVDFEGGATDIIPFDGSYKPDAGELLRIDNFADVDGLQEAASNPINVEWFNPAQHPLSSVKALFASKTVDGSTRILIQLFEPRRLVASKGLTIFYSGHTFTKMSDAGLTLDTRLLAVLEGTTLTFQRFHFLSRVFDMTQHFKQATNEEVGAFATHAKLAVQDVDAFLQSASVTVRRKIALIAHSGVLDNFAAAHIVASAHAFGVAIATDGAGRIVVPTDKVQLRNLLRVLNEDYFESALSQTRMLTNSKRVAD